MYAYSELSIFLHLDRSIMCMVQPIQPLEQALITLVICKYYAQLLLVLVIQTVSLTLCPFSPLGGSQGNPFVFSKKKHINLQMTLGDFGLISWFSTMKAKINGSPSWISSTSSVILRCVERAAREYTNIIHASSRQSWLWRNVWISHYLWSLRANATLTTGLDHFQTRDLEERQTDLGIKFRVTQSQSPAHWSFMIPWLVRNCSLNEEKRGELTQKLPRCLKHLTDLDSAVICKSILLANQGLWNRTMGRNGQRSHGLICLMRWLRRAVISLKSWAKGLQYVLHLDLNILRSVEAWISSTLQVFAFGPKSCRNRGATNWKEPKNWKQTIHHIPQEKSQAKCGKVSCMHLRADTRILMQ